MRSFNASARAGLLLSAAAAIHAQPCTPDWIPAFGGSELTGPIRALTSFDFDGPGPEGPSLVALQVRNTFAGPPHRPVIRWTPQGWVPIGGTELNYGAVIPGQRSALTVFDCDAEGPLPACLYACGSMNLRGTRRQIARFDGVAWNQLDSRFSSSSDRLFDMLVFDEDGPGPALPALYVAGQVSGLIPFVAKWDGSDWADIPIGAEQQGSVYDLESWDPDGPGPALPTLFATGGFFQAFSFEPPPPSYLASLNGASWQPVGLGLPNRPGIGLGMTVFDPDGPGPALPALVVVSEVNAIDNRLTADVTLWDGHTWTPILSSNSSLPVISSFGPENGRAWTHDEDGPGPLPPALFVARSLNPADPTGSTISRWDGQSWSVVGDFGPQLGININGTYLTTKSQLDALTTFDFDGDGPQLPALVVGGGFTAVPRVPLMSCVPIMPFVDLLTTNMIASWDGEEWGALNNGLSWNMLTFGHCEALSPLDPDGPGPAPESLYVHGGFASAGNTSIPLRSCIAGYPASVDAMRSANARYSATTGWQRAGLDPDIDPRTNPRRIHADTDFDPDGPGPAPATKHIAGSFDQLDSTPAVGPLARWNPALNSGAGGWENFGARDGGSAVFALQPFDPDGPGPAPQALIAAGDFVSVYLNESSASGAVVAWNGSAWSTTNFVSGGASVTDLTLFDPDDASPTPARLIAAGDFVQPTSLGNAKDIAQFDGLDWTPLGNGSFTGSADGSSTRINALAVFNNGLYAAGNFLQWTDGVTPITARGLARWNGTQWSATAPSLDPAVDGCASLTEPLLFDLIVFDPDGPSGATPNSLFAAGGFTAPGTTSQGIARWDGSAWHALGAGLTYLPYRVCGGHPVASDLEVFDDDGPGPNPPALFIAGTFLKADDRSSWALAKWGCTPSAAPPPCPGDANADLIVNFTDITAVLTNWLLPGPDGDANHDGSVNFADITEVLTFFSVPCP